VTVSVYLVDGPALGSYETEFDRAPEQLTAVTSTIDGAAAVLDLPGDMPALGENTHVYTRRGCGHVCGRPGGCETVWNYALATEPWQAFTPLRPVPDAG
jgi:hypothetical protein